MLGFRNLIQHKNACKVRQSQEWEKKGRKMYTEREMLVCHEFLPDGRYRTEYIRNGLEELADFICSSEKDKLVCNGEDYAIASTIGEDLDLCVESFRNEFFDIYIEYRARMERPLADEY